ncbi:MAG TPA: carbohydrate ABC transporter substrate-binding protein [Firmicutes bacterium]|jgi:glucose/mannose transport system substrate-binding protein|nr:carbohydrate ABC transporter substrate-binding protein [Bacillota bacterium]
MKISRWLRFAIVCAAMVFVFASVAQAAVSGKLEIFSWWAGDEGPALEALIDKYEKMYPGVNVVNSTVTGGAGVHAKAVLKTRLLGGDPPDTFQVHAGQELIGTWVVADRMEDLTKLYEQEGWHNVFPADLVKLLSTDKGIWSVPVNIHRSNVMFFIPDNLSKWGIGVPATWEEFLKIAPDLKAKGVIPLSVAENWTQTHLWESVALSVLGPDKWEKLWNGELSWKSPEVIKAWEMFGDILEYTNADASSLSWQQATDMVVKGQAAFNIMGDWAAGYMTTTLKLKPGTGFGWAASPGTNGIFMMLSDSFGLPVGCPNRENAIAWLKMLGSRDGQDAFNPLKGSISARTDSDLSKYDAYLQSAANDWRSNKIVGSLAHGVTANERFMNDFATVMEIFLQTKNAKAAANAAEAVAIQAGIGR